MTVLDKDVLEMLVASARGDLARVWGPATAAGEADAEDRLAATAARGVDQGWSALAEDRLLGALVAILTELGSVACPLPLADTFVASMVFAGDDAVVARIASGQWRVVLGVRMGEEILADGAAGATHVLLLPSPGEGRAELVELAGSTPWPGMAVPPWRSLETARSVGPSGPAASIELDGPAADEARAVVRLGLVARCLGAARRAHDLAVDHAKTRVQFGRLIGSFQAVSHRTVDAAIALRAGSLLLDEAVLAYDDGDGGARFLLATELAVAHGVKAAPKVQMAAHHTLAAVGYFEEHEAPWLFRRVHSDIALLAAFPLEAGGVADQLLEGDASLPDLDLGPVAAAFRSEVRQVLSGLDDGTWDGHRDDDPVLVAALAARGYIAVSWPEELGGRGATPEEAFVLGEEVAYHRAPCAHALGAVGMIGGALFRHGTPDQRARFLPLFAEGKMSFYLGYSEPEVGSDLANLSTTAVPDGDDWVINGRKMWGTGAHSAEWAWVATRTDREATPPHAGITVFLFPTGLPGWEAHQHRSLSGGISCSTFFDGVRVPDSARIGEVNGGWKVLTSALAGERAVLAGSTARQLRQLDDILAGLRSGPSGPPLRGSGARALVGELATKIQAARTVLVASLRAISEGGGSRLEAPMAKILSTSLGEEVFPVALDLFGPTVALGPSSPQAGEVPGGGDLEYAHRLSLMQSIGGGTADIQRNLIARSLGLPR